MTNTSITTVELPDQIHDYIEVNLTGVEIESDYGSEEGHGFHEVGGESISYEIESICVEGMPIEYTLTNDQIEELEYKLIENQE